MREHETDYEEESVKDQSEEYVEYLARHEGKRKGNLRIECRRVTRQFCKRRFPSNTEKQHIFIDLTEELESGPRDSSSKDNTKKTSEPDNDQVSSHLNSAPSIGTSHPHANLQESMDAHQEPLENKVDEAQKKLASLLAMDFSHLVTTENLEELTNVISVIKKDSNLSLEQLLKLHKIEKIPLLGRCFLKANQEMTKYDKCCVSLMPNIAKIISLNHCYNQCKDRAAQMQAEINESLLAKRGLDEEMAQFQTQHAQLVGEIEVGSSKSPELETRKAEMAKRMVKIIAKHAF